jgi:TRAP-type C4-dicarboxylate transport system permease small subunit
MVLWLTFLGASLAARENRHIRIDIFGFILPPKWIPFRELSLSILCLMISGIMVKVSMDFVRLEMVYGGTLFAHFPAWIGEIIMPVGFSLICFRFMIRILEKCLEIIRS